MINNRDKCQEFLQKKGISSAIPYPVPVPLQKSFEHLGYSSADLPVSYEISQKTLFLPMFPELNEEDVNYIARGVKEFLSASSV